MDNLYHRHASNAHHAVLVRHPHLTSAHHKRPPTNRIRGQSHAAAGKNRPPELTDPAGLEEKFTVRIPWEPLERWSASAKGRAVGAPLSAAPSPSSRTEHRLPKGEPGHSRTACAPLMSEKKPEGSPLDAPARRPRCTSANDPRASAPFNADTEHRPSSRSPALRKVICNVQTGHVAHAAGKDRFAFPAAAALRPSPKPSPWRASSPAGAGAQEATIPRIP